MRKIYRLALAVGRLIVSSEARAEWRLEFPRRIEAWKAFIWPPPTAEEVVFNGIFEENRWGSQESNSGGGSTLDGTEIVRRELPRIVERFKIKKILDLPCGDFNWMRHVELGVKRYVGGDIVQEIVAANKAKYGRWGRKFKWMNLIESRLPKADLLLCRDCLVHLSFEDIQKVLDNLHRSKIKYLLTTTYTNRPANFDIPTGMWLPRNLEAEPFNFPEPILSINENCRESYPDFNDKSLALWRIEDIPRFLDLPGFTKNFTPRR
jgi:hypothetical protein